MRDRRGVVAVMFAMSVLLLGVAVGSGIDLERAYMARQQLSAVATLTCQYANRPIIASLAYGSGGSAAYIAQVNSFYGSAMTAQNVTWTQATSAPFTYAAGGAGAVALTASIPATMMRLAGVTSIPVGISIQCFNNIAAVAQPVADATAKLLVNEGFENSAYPSSITWYLPTSNYEPYGASTYSIPKTNTAPATVGYVGSNGNVWIVMGYCIETDHVGKTQATVPEGSQNGELDCDNGSDTAGNSSMSTRIYLAVGSYELRWDYAGRISNTYYQTSYICGTTAADLSWANDTSYTYGSTSLGSRTNQINVYLDQNTTGSPPTHTTIDGTQTLAGSNLIDECVYSSGWIERSVLINVTSAGYYWLSFAADGANDSYGGDIDNIRLCAGTCSGTAGDDFPTAWLPANNGGNNALLFEDTFEVPTCTSCATYYDGNFNTSNGASSFWGESGKGWGNAPVNHGLYFSSGCPQGSLCIQLGLNKGGAQNYWIAKGFLLDPGYYQISYYYVSQVTFTGLNSYASGYFCGATPSAAHISVLTAGNGNATNRVTGTFEGDIPWQTTTIGLFMAHILMASEPIPSSTYNASTTYMSPSQTTETSPSVPPNSINLASFTQSTISPLLDICGYAATAVLRTVDVSIQKAALYYLVFSVFPSYTDFGGQLDDIKITALGSPWMTGAPSNPVVIPVPNPQPGSTLSFTGFSITADQY